jgi:hypothetical protein
MKVSWQVTGVRKDRYAQKHRILAEIKKEVKDRGKYLHPRVFGKSDTMRIGWDEKADDREQLKKKQFVAEKKEASKLRWETLKKSIKKDEMIAQKIVADQKSRKPTELKNLKGKMNKARKDLNKMVKNLRK